MLSRTIESLTLELTRAADEILGGDSPGARQARFFFLMAPIFLTAMVLASPYLMFKVRSIYAGVLALCLTPYILHRTMLELGHPRPTDT